MTNISKNPQEISSKEIDKCQKKKYQISGTIFEVDQKYKVFKQIGTGAYGVVASGINRITHQRVAIKKVINAFQDPVDAKRILREIKLLKFLNHQNIIKLVEVSKPSTSTNYQDVYIITELMETDLHRVIYTDQKLTEDHIQYIIYQLLRGLLYMHSANIIHRDLKPSNLLIDKRWLSRGYTDQDDEMTEYVVTRWYRAPQIVLKSCQYSKSVDIWSVGCILAELLGRTALFPGQNYLDQIQRIISILGSPSQNDLQYIHSQKALKYIKTLSKRTRQPWQKVFPGFSKDTYDLLTNMLTFNPDKRFSVEQCLAHPYFKDIHDKKYQTLSSKVFDWSWDKFIPTSQNIRNMIYQQSLEYTNQKPIIQKQNIIKQKQQQKQHQK